MSLTNTVSEKTISEKTFKDEVRSWAGEIKANPKEIRIRKMKNKWASCSSSGRLTFNSDLIYEPEEFRREVIVHELLHLKVPNHGRLFKALLKAYLAEAEDRST